MPRQSTRFNFESNQEPSAPFCLLENIIEDRGSRYSVSYGRVLGRADIHSFLSHLKQDAHYASADHNSWAVRITRSDAIYESRADDGELGAGQIILREMQKQEVVNCIICVTRWFGGTKLMADRFKHVQDATQQAILHLCTNKR